MKRACVFIVTLIVCVLTACSTTISQNPSEESTNQAPTLTIGVSLNSADEFRTAWLNEFIRMAAEKNYRVIHTNADSDASKQISDIESILLQRPDVMVVHAYHREGIIPALEDVKKQNIPCVAIDFIISSKNLYDVYVCDDQTKVAKIQVDYINAWLAEDPERVANIGCIYGEISSSKNSRQNLFYAEMGIEKPMAEASGNWQADQAMAITEDWIQAYPEMNVFVCMNDDMAIGAIQALTAAGKNMDDVLVLGIDGLSGSIKYLKSGELDCTVARDITKEVQTAFEACEGLVEGKTYEKRLYPNAIYALTKENVGEYYD